MIRLLKFINLKTIIFLLIFSQFFYSCGIYKSVDARSVPAQAKDRARKNVEEGRGISLQNLVKRNGGNFEFSSSNPLWRATLETIDFIPFSTVDYSGGIIITDWYSDTTNKNESLKITVRFLSNEVRADSLKITVHKKNCDKNNNCSTNIFNSKINQELNQAILKKAALLANQIKK